jgi:hypothetical protein
VRGANGSIIPETMIWPDDDVIERKLKVGFFYAACCGGLPQTHVTSPSLANRICRSEFLNDAKNIAFIQRPG